MAYKVFISYSTKDIPNVESFVSEYAVTPGAPLAPTIRNAILECDLFVLLWSKNAEASEWVSQEIGIAHGRQKPILPFVLEKGLSLPGFIKELRYVAAFQNPQQAMPAGNGAEKLDGEAESASLSGARNRRPSAPGVSGGEQEFLSGKRRSKHL
jgi:hypothetical protein